MPTGGGGRSSTAASRAAGSIADRLGMMSVNKAAAQRDIAEAQLMDSERVRLEQDANSQGRDSAGMGPVTSNQDVVLGPAEFYKPEVPMSS